jgi:hypothetical protein
MGTPCKRRALEEETSPACKRVAKVRRRGRMRDFISRGVEGQGSEAGD